MNHYQPEIIWYASDAYARHPLRFVAPQDKGSLALEQGRLTFHGHRRTLHMYEIRDITVTWQAPGLPGWLFLAAAIAFLAFVRGASPLVLCLAAASGVTVGYAIAYSTKWVRITFRDDDGNESVAWFADGSGLGWGGILGGTSRLYELLHSLANEMESTGEYSEAKAAQLPKRLPVPSDVRPYEGMVLGATPRLRQPREPKPETCPWCEAWVTPDEDGGCPECNRLIT
ncbi:MAG: hypothetical protein RIC55_33570 [Pirellulaceae bacterium]